MAVNTLTRSNYKRTIFNLLTVTMMGWLVLLSWTMTLWIRFGFDAAYLRLKQLSQQQRAAIVEFNDNSIAARWSSVLAKLPIKTLSLKVSEINHSISNALPNKQLINSELTYTIKDALQITKQFLLLVGLACQVLVIKLIILLAAIPLFALALTVGLVDGLNQRAIRTASLGRESSYVFHKLNRILRHGLLVLLSLWLAIPASITPALVLIPVSVLLSIMVSMTASRFKKYL